MGSPSDKVPPPKKPKLADMSSGGGPKIDDTTESGDGCASPTKMKGGANYGIVLGKVIFHHDDASDEDAQRKMPVYVLDKNLERFLKLIPVGSKPETGFPAFVLDVLKGNVIPKEVLEGSSMTEVEILTFVERRDEAFCEHLLAYGHPFSATDWELCHKYLKPALAGDFSGLPKFFSTKYNGDWINVYSQHPKFLARTLIPAPTDSEEMEWYFISRRVYESDGRKQFRHLPTGEEWKYEGAKLVGLGSPLPTSTKVDKGIFSGARYMLRPPAFGISEVFTLCLEKTRARTLWELQMVKELGEISTQTNTIVELAVCKLTLKASKALKKLAATSTPEKKKATSTPKK